MANLQDFINYLNSFVNRAIYIWGGQTQVIRGGIVYKDDSFKKELGEAAAWIKDKETSTKNANRAIKLYNSRKNKYDVIPCVDCSGLGMNYLQNKTGIFGSDMTANGMKGKCTLISKSDLKKGDWVFRTYKSGSNKGRAYHIGYVVDDNLNVVHSKGRDDGTVKEAFSSTYWNTYGRPKIFADEINGNESNDNKPVVAGGVPIARNLKYTSPMMAGDDVKELQKLLNNANGAGLAPDGKFGKLTKNAVKAYQKAKGLTQDGIAGKKTVTALGGNWTVFERVLKDTAPNMQGEDVRALQILLNGVARATLEVDGDFGTKTAAAVRSYQGAKGLAVDGAAGKNTITALGGIWRG